MTFENIVGTMGLPFVLVYVVMVLGFIYFAFISIPKTFKTRSWPTAIGQVTSSKLYKGKRIAKSGGAVAVYSADIEYTYEVDGKEYDSKKIKWVDHNSNNKTHHQKVVETYAEGQTVSVFYNPKNPSIGLLEPGFGAGNLIGFLFFLLGLGSMTAVLLTKL